MKPLRQKMFDALEQRNFPPRTIEAYVAAVVALSRHYRVSPDTLSPAQVQAWLQLQRRAVADLPFQILVRALAFFFVEVLAWPIVHRGKGVDAPPPAHKTSALRQRLTDDLKLRNFSPRTISAYVGAIARFARHFRKCPTQLGASEIRAWQLLLHSRGLSFSTYNVSSCALRFLYCVVLGKPDMTAVIPFARAERKLPVILSQGEVCTLLRATGSDRDRLVVTVAYACGLRVFKLASLRSVDVDNARACCTCTPARGAKIDSCLFRIPCCTASPNTCAFIGPVNGSFPAKARALRSTRAPFSASSPRRRRRPASPNTSRPTCCGTASRPII